MDFERIIYTAVGALPRIEVRLPSAKKVVEQPSGEKPADNKPHIVFSFWYAPKAQKARALMRDLHDLFDGDGLPIGVGLFTRPMGDVKYKAHIYNSDRLEGFLDAAADTKTPVFVNTSGMQWTEVAYGRSPLITELSKNKDNLMTFNNGDLVGRKLQPPGGLLRGLLGSDRNGVVYLSHTAEAVNYYRERTLARMAEAVQPFAKAHPELYLGISTENEVDFPGRWIGGDREVFDEEERVRIVTEILTKNVKIFRNAGLTKIYTNQSVEDAQGRGSPLSTADIPGSSIGVTAWRLDNTELFSQVEKLAWEKDKKWALVITNPLSLNYRANVSELQRALRYGPDFIGVYNWWPHFLGYGIKGMPLEQAIKTFTKEVQLRYEVIKKVDHGDPII